MSRTEYIIEPTGDIFVSQHDAATYVNNGTSFTMVDTNDMMHDYNCYRFVYDEELEAYRCSSAPCDLVEADFKKLEANNMITIHAEAPPEEDMDTLD